MRLRGRRLLFWVGRGSDFLGRRRRWWWRGRGSRGVKKKLKERAKEVGDKEVDGLMMLRETEDVHE